MDDDQVTLGAASFSVTVTGIDVEAPFPANVIEHDPGARDVMATLSELDGAGEALGVVDGVGDGDGVTVVTVATVAQVFCCEIVPLAFCETVITVGAPPSAENVTPPLGMLPVIGGIVGVGVAVGVDVDCPTGTGPPGDVLPPPPPPPHEAIAIKDASTR